MKVEIIIEPLDNGIILHWKDLKGELEKTHTLALQGEEEEQIGKLIWPDIQYLMDETLSGKVKMTIKYEEKES